MRDGKGGETRVTLEYATLNFAIFTNSANSQIVLTFE